MMAEPAWGLLIAVFLACAVETVEAVTIVLAIGLTRGWRSAWAGVLSGLVVLALFVVVTGAALGSIPLHSLRAVVGVLLLIFGLQWLRKAILRAAGLKNLRDEKEEFDQELVAARQAPRVAKGIDGYGFTIVFKGILLEGLEVAFIVVTLGASHDQIAAASLGAAIAVLVTVGFALAIRQPLSRVPENKMKFGVGVMLSAFGAFWAGEGVGVEWPGDDGALVGLILFILVTSMALVSWLEHTRGNGSSLRSGHG